MNDVTDVICTLLLCKYPSIDAVYEYSVPWFQPRILCQKIEKSIYISKVIKIISHQALPEVFDRKADILGTETDLLWLGQTITMNDKH